MSFNSELEFERLLQVYTASLSDLLEQRRSPNGWYYHVVKRYVKCKLDLYSFVSDVCRSENQG